MDMITQTDLPVTVLTGATGGMGQAITEDLVQDRMVVAVGRNRDKLEQLVSNSERGDRIVPLVCDVERDLERLDELFAGLPRVDELLNVAAVAPRFRLDDARAETWDHVLRTNVTAPAELTRVLLPRLREAQGTVVFIGSGVSRASYADNVVYAASKHALQAVADGFRKQVSADGVRVATVAPGFTDTPMVQWEDDYPLTLPEVLIEPGTVARSIRHVLDAPADTQITEVWVRPRQEV